MKPLPKHLQSCKFRIFANKADSVKPLESSSDWSGFSFNNGGVNYPIGKVFGGFDIQTLEVYYS